MVLAPAGYARSVSRKKPLTERGVKRMVERERAVGLDPEDPAAQWLAENDKQPAPAPPKSASKSKALHRWRQSRGPSGG
jgi:hypothetical protein